MQGEGEWKETKLARRLKNQQQRKKAREKKIENHIVVAEERGAHEFRCVPCESADAMDLQAVWNIDKLALTLFSPRVKKLVGEGYEEFALQTQARAVDQPDGYFYKTVALNNKYQDELVFRRVAAPVVLLKD